MPRPRQVRIDEFSAWDLDGPLERAVDLLSKALARKDDFDKLYIDVSEGHHEDVSISIWGFNKLTPEEVEAEREERKTQAERQERSDYLRLRDKYGHLSECEECGGLEPVHLSECTQGPWNS